MRSFNESAGLVTSSVTHPSGTLDLPGCGTEFHLAHPLSKLQGTQRFSNITLQSRNLSKEQNDTRNDLYHLNYNLLLRIRQESSHLHHHDCLAAFAQGVLQ